MRAPLTDRRFRQLVEVFGPNAARRAQGITEESPFMNWYSYAEKMAIRFDEFTTAAREAVEVLEDQLDHEREAGEGWKLAAADYYGQNLDLKLKVRELNWAQANPRVDISSVFYLTQEKDAHDRTKAALRDAEAKIAELHLSIASLRQQRDDARRKNGRRFEVVESSVYDTQTGRYIPFGSPSTAEQCARDFNAGKDEPGKYISLDRP